MSADVDPRVERSRRVITDAALEVLAEAGYGELTIEGVARRAGVGKSTIYRHWDSKLSLVTDAVSTLEPVTAGGSPDTGIRERVVAHLRAVRDVLDDSRWAAILPAVISAAARHPEVADWHRTHSARRRQQLVDLLDEGVARSELPAGLDTTLVAESLFGPVFLRRVMLGEIADDDRIERIVDLVLPGRG